MNMSLRASCPNKKAGHSLLPCGLAVLRAKYVMSPSCYCFCGWFCHCLCTHIESLQGIAAFILTKRGDGGLSMPLRAFSVASLILGAGFCASGATLWAIGIREVRSSAIAIHQTLSPCCRTHWNTSFIGIHSCRWKIWGVWVEPFALLLGNRLAHTLKKDLSLILGPLEKFKAPRVKYQQKVMDGLSINLWPVKVNSTAILFCFRPATRALLLWLPESSCFQPLWKIGLVARHTEIFMFQRDLLIFFSSICRLDRRLVLCDSSLLYWNIVPASWVSLPVVSNLLSG